MKILRFFLLTCALLLACSINIHSQSLKEIITKNTHVMGGKKILKSINSIYTVNTIEAMGSESPSKTIILKGKGAKTISSFAGQSMIQCYNDKDGWMINPMTGSSTATIMSDYQYKSGRSQIYISKSLWDFE
jgi:hypothetical protein